MPIPLAVMPPFMAYQSILIGDAFGRGYQFGKRKVSELSNEQIKKMSIDDVFRDASVDYLRMIPTVKESMAQSLDLQVFIVKELIKIIPAMTTMFTKEAPPIIDKAIDTAVDQGFGLKQLADAIASIGHTTADSFLPPASADDGGVKYPVIESRFNPKTPTGKRIVYPSPDLVRVSGGKNIGLQKGTPYPKHKSKGQFRLEFNSAKKGRDSFIRIIKTLQKVRKKAKGSYAYTVDNQIRGYKKKLSKEIADIARLATNYYKIYGQTLK